MTNKNSGIAFCPCCGSKEHGVSNVFSVTWAVVCQTCSIVGPFRVTQHGAIAAWNSLPRMEGLRFAADHSELFKAMGILPHEKSRCLICKTPKINKEGWRVQACECQGLVPSLYDQYPEITPPSKVK